MGLKSSTILQSVADAAIWTSKDGSSNSYNEEMHNKERNKKVKAEEKRGAEEI